MAIHAQLLDVLPQAVVLLDRELQVRLANKAASRLFRLQPEELIGASITSLVPSNDLPRLILEPGEESVRVIEIHPEPGRENQAARILKITISRPPVDPDEECLLLVLEDVSERVMLENQLVEAEKLAGMSQLAAGITHELRNPMSGINSNLQYVRETLLGNGHGAVIESLDATLDSLNQMHRLLYDLSAFTHQPHPHYELADLARLVRRSLVLIAREAELRGIQLVTRIAEALPPCQLDPRAISQVLLNLLKNAIEAMPEGGRLTVTARPGSLSADGTAAVVLEVEDTGIGVEEADLRKVFRPLFTTKPGGSGLGLSFCRQTVEEHGGEIRLGSQKGQGTRVTLLLPLRQEAEVFESTHFER
ncbi:MAG: ATP-binding protein [Acidobacteriota bacterium]